MSSSTTSQRPAQSPKTWDMSNLKPYQLSPAWRSQLNQGKSLSLKEQKRLFKDLEFISFRFNEIIAKSKSMPAYLQKYYQTVSPPPTAEKRRHAEKRRLERKQASLAKEIAALKLSTKKVTPTHLPPGKGENSFVSSTFVSGKVACVSTDLSKKNYENFKKCIRRGAAASTKSFTKGGTPTEAVGICKDFRTNKVAIVGTPAPKALNALERRCNSKLHVPRQSIIANCRTESLGANFRKHALEPLDSIKRTPTNRGVLVDLRSRILKLESSYQFAPANFTRWIPLRSYSSVVKNRVAREKSRLI